MRSLSLCTACALSLAFITGCGGGDKRAEQPVIAGVQMPAWFMEPGKDGNIGATGVAQKSLGGPGEQLKLAMAEARTALANTISVKVQASFTRFFSEGGENSWAADGSIDKTTIAQELSENVSRQITNQVIQGSERKAVWEHPTSRELYVWVVINPAKRDQVLTQVKAAARKQLASRKKIAAELKTEDALKKLDAAINAEMFRMAGEVPPAAN